MSKYLRKPDTSFEDLSPEARELFDRLINNTRFLNAFEHILKAQRYLTEKDRQKELSWQAERKRDNQIAALDIPEGYKCVSVFELGQADYYHAQYFIDEAVREIGWWGHINFPPAETTGNDTEDKGDAEL